MNAHLACLYSALREVQNFATDVITVSPSDRLTFGPSQSMGAGDQRNMQLALARFPSTYASPPLFDWRISTRLVIELGTLERAADKLASLTSQGRAYLELAGLGLRAAKAAQDHDYSLSLTLSWVGTETVLQGLWTAYIADNRTRNGAPFINARRKHRLEDARTYSAAVVAELLSHVDVLPLDTYEAQVLVRQARNEWVHDRRPVTRAEAEQAADLFAKVVELHVGIDLHIPIVSRLHF